jgi:hypothetical protein
MKLRACVLVALLLPACKKEEVVVPDYLEPFSKDPVGVIVGDAIGTRDQIRLPVFAINAAGAPVPADAISLTSSATLESGSITPGGDGWGEAVLLPGQEGLFPVTATAGGASGLGNGYAVAAKPGRLEFPVIPSTQVSELAAAGGGLAWAIGGDLWWGRPEAQAVKVLSLAEEIVALNPVQADGDGVTDLMVQSESGLFLLKGRDEGGLAWGAGFSASAAMGSAQVSGATVADLDGDTVPDLLVSLEGDGITRVVWLKGDGLYNFTQEKVLEIAYKVFGVSGEDFDKDGTAEISVLTEDGLLRRYGEYDGGWIPATTADYDLEIGPGSRLLPSQDVDGDRIVDILAIGPGSDGAGYRAWAVTIGGADPKQFRLLADLDPEWSAMAVGDLTGDGLVEIVLTSPDALRRVIWDKDEGPVVYGTTGVPLGPAVAIGNFDGPNPDGSDLPDVVVGVESGLVVLAGDSIEDDPETPGDESVPWRVRTPTGSVLAINAAGAMWVGDATGDGIVDVVGFVNGDTSVGVRAFIGIPAGEEAESLDGGNMVSLSGAGTPLGVAVCGNTLHALLDIGEPTLYRYTVAVDGILSEALPPITIPGGNTVACGNFAAGDVVVGVPDGHLTYVDAAGFVNEGEPSTGVVSLTARDADGDGLETVEQCATTGCVVEAGDLDGDGLEDKALLEEGVLTIEAGGASYTLSKAATGLWVGDVDGDGVSDVVAGGGGYWRSYRVVAGGIVPADAHFVLWPIEGRVPFGDLSGDGLPDLLCNALPDTDPDDLAEWDGRLVYIKASME